MEIYGLGDSRRWSDYAAAMGAGQPFIRLKLNTDEPIQLDSFVGAFTAIGDEYDKFARTRHPETDPEATLFVKEVRAGSIEALLVPVIFGALPTLMQNANEIAEFVRNYGSMLGVYIKPQGRIPNATEGQLKNFTDQVAAIADSPHASLEAAAISIENGQEKTHAAFKFDTRQSGLIREHVNEHRREIEQVTEAPHKRVLMIFTRIDSADATVGKRSGERVVIGSISDKKLAVIFASPLSEQRIRHEIRDEPDNAFYKGFVVDVSVEMRGGKPAAYKVTRFHKVVDLPRENED